MNSRHRKPLTVDLAVRYPVQGHLGGGPEVAQVYVCGPQRTPAPSTYATSSRRVQPTRELTELCARASPCYDIAGFQKEVLMPRNRPVHPISTIDLDSRVASDLRRFACLKN
jgi:hypothetical protein